MKIIKVSAVWCVECLSMNPVWDSIAMEMPTLNIQAVDADDNEELLKELNIKDIPTFIFIDKDEQELFRIKGLQKKEKLVELIKENLDK